MDIDESFYRNVFLLMQVEPASYECKKLFTKGMFSKPNTSGFIHLSHYLLSIHNEKRFKKMVIWPIWSKADETRYRLELKKYMDLLSIENADVRFPVILKSHLLQAGGVKLLVLMWKISQIALRAYIERTYSIELLNFPKAGENRDVTERYFLILNKKGREGINKLREEETLFLESFKSYVKHKSDELERTTRTAIFQLQENIEQITSVLPVHPLIAKRLKDIDDTEIIKLWKESIAQNIEYLNDKNSKLKRLKDMTDRCINIIMDSCVNNKVLDGNDLPKVNYETLACLNIQLNGNSLYKDGCLVLQVLLAIFDQAFKRTEYYLRKDDKLDLTKWEPEMSERCENLKSIEERFRKLAEQVTDRLRDCQNCSLFDKTKNCTFDTHSICPTSLQTILLSPKYNLPVEDQDKEMISERMLVSPVTGKHDHLFKKYKCNLFGTPRMSPGFQFNDSTVSNLKSPQRQLINQRRSNETKLPARYSRLFSTAKQKKSYFKDNNAASTPNQSLRTSKSTAIEGENEEDIFDLSYKITDVVSSLSKSKH